MAVCATAQQKGVPKSFAKWDAERGGEIKTRLDRETDKTRTRQGGGWDLKKKKGINAAQRKLQGPRMV